MKQKPLKEWLKQLPLNARLNYMEALRRDRAMYKDAQFQNALISLTDSSDVIGGYFIWEDTTQGQYYWSNINTKMRHKWKQ